MKKILALLLALALLLPTVAMAELNRVSEEPVEFTFWAAYNPTFQTDWENRKCWKYLERSDRRPRQVGALYPEQR